MAETMTKTEREELQRLVRQREKVQKSAAKLRSAELMADFENQMGAVYQPADDPVWEEVTAAAMKELANANRRIAARCHELGIAKGCAPTLSIGWSYNGIAHATKERRVELRTMAKRRVEAIEQKAILDIEISSVDAQTNLAMAGLTSDAARAFVERLPTIESLMPKLSFEEFVGEADPPVSEQLTSPNTLRQRRFRERQASAIKEIQANETEK